MFDMFGLENFSPRKQTVDLTAFSFSLIYFLTKPVWPDVGMKSGHNFPTVAQKLATAGFTWKVAFLKIAQKALKYLDYFCNKICVNKFQKSPNLVTLDEAYQHRQIKSAQNPPFKRKVYPLPENYAEIVWFKRTTYVRQN